MTFEDKIKLKNNYLNLKKLYLSGKTNKFLKEAEKYLELNPKDIDVRYKYAKTLKYEERFDECIKHLKIILQYEPTNKNALYFLYFTYYYLGMYVEAYNLSSMVINNCDCNKSAMYLTRMVIKKNLNIPFDENENICDKYVKMQIINYSKASALYQIEKHLRSCDEQECENPTQFADINLKYLIDVVSEKIPTAKKTNGTDVMDIYYFKVFNVGLSTNDICDNIKVVVVPGTTNIINMYPVNKINSKYVSLLDIDYDKLFKRENKVKKMSRIDKFNKKYNR